MKKSTIFLALLVVLPFITINSQWIIRNNVSTDVLYAVFFPNSLTGWVGGDGSTLFKTTNGGINWTGQTTGMPTTGIFKSLYFVNTSRGWVVGTYQSTGMLGYIYRTTNGGTSWTQQSALADHAFYGCFAYDTANFYVVGTYQNTSGTICKTVNGGLNWTYPVSGQYSPLRCVYFLNYLSGWAGGINTILRTTNSGSNWTFMNFTGTVVSIRFIDGITGWVGTDDGKLLKTTNGGASFLSSINGYASSSLNSIQFPSTGTGYCANSSIVFKTTNSGSNWIPMETGVASDIEAMHCPSISNLFCATFDGHVVYTNNGGGTYNQFTATFRRSNLNKPITMNNTTFDTLTVSIPGYNSSILDVNVLIDTVVNHIDSNLIFILSHQGVSDTVIYRAGGGGDNFIRTVLNDSATIPISAGVPPFTGSYKPSKPLSKFNYLPPNGQWILRIKESQTGVRTGVIKSWGITLTYNVTISVKKISEIVPDNFELSQNYPNPFNPNTNIKYQIAKSKDVNLKVFDILGKEVATLVNEKQTPGVYEITFDGSKLPSGVYFYRLSTGDFSETKKMILIK